ncbi:hypothetical protein B0H14DRAFT_2801792 [Mycena olivaceomarginata]|nr:hypothetical protein B0H14DRAFT_2801792 [Mycena olivaceomarginata]
MSLELPPELWSEIFKILPWRSLPAVYAVSSLFSEISRSLLFWEFVFYPRRAREEDTMELEFRRLKFWSSPKIAPHVRKLTVNLVGIGEKLIRNSPSPLVLAFLDAFPRFTALQDLICCTHRTLPMEISALRVSSPSLRLFQIHSARLVPSVHSPSIFARGLAQIPSAETSASGADPGRREYGLGAFAMLLTQPVAWATRKIALNLGYVALESTPPHKQLRIEHFSYTDMPFPDPGAESQLRLLDPSSLRRLDLQSQSLYAIHHFLGDAPATSSLHNLHVVELTFPEPTFSEIHACLSLLPAIRDLTLNVTGRCTSDAFPEVPLAPHLTKFKGPAVLLPLVLLGTAPQALTITRGRREYASEFLHALQASRRRAIGSVTSLALPVRYLTLVEGSDVLADALSFFPSLNSLSVTVYSRAPSHIIPPAINSRALCERLAKTLSVATTLRTVVIHWSLDGDDPSEIVPSLSVLEGVLRSAIPELMIMSVSYRGRLW